MRPHYLKHPFPRLAFLALIVATLAAAHAPRAASDREIARLQAHFKTVEAELLSADVSHLSAAQRLARARHIAVLREYARTAVFPHNHDYAGERIPYFRDAHGKLCAMAYLIARSGREDLVDRVARSANNAYLPELARDPDLKAWLHANGLSVAEAARIQPSYGWEPGADVNVKARRNYERATVAASVVSGGVVAWALLNDPQRGSYAPGLTAIGVGLLDLTVALGGAVADDHGGLPGLNAIVGSVTTVSGIASTIRVLNRRRARDDQPATSSQSQAWQPIFHNDARGRTHLGLNLRFK